MGEAAVFQSKRSFPIRWCGGSSMGLLESKISSLGRFLLDRRRASLLVCKRGPAREIWCLHLSVRRP